ncbi:hypothetical protein ACFVFQ_34880 [Streptomyces sp. NPDC057743]|uniref:hypothetical protein n=1 Tax=Streptomyces sp. NPDC057743 TaxID=3346236 RepID=UPI0036C61285
MTTVALPSPPPAAQGVSRSSEGIGAALERRVDVRLVKRTSRRVELARLGAQFVDEVRPTYESLLTVFSQARERAGRGTLCQLRIGFHGSIYEEVTEAFRRLRPLRWAPRPRPCSTSSSIPPWSNSRCRRPN